MLPTPPELIVIELEHCHILAHVEVLYLFILVAFSDHWVRVVNHLMQLDPYLVLDSDLACMVRAPTIKQSVSHQSHRERAT